MNDIVGMYFDGIYLSTNEYRLASQPENNKNQIFPDLPITV